MAILLPLVLLLIGVMIVGACYTVLEIFDALYWGRIYFGPRNDIAEWWRDIDRGENPLLFWHAVSVHLALCLICSASGLVLLTNLPQIIQITA
jgi:hypothetical protein